MNYEAEFYEIMTVVESYHPDEDTCKPLGHSEILKMLSSSKTTRLRLIFSATIFAKIRTVI